jgi:predicted Rossmann fold nucleotide-binding protein DprA/Smf involved in DNA uptake
VLTFIEVAIYYTKKNSAFAKNLSRTGRNDEMTQASNQLKSIAKHLAALSKQVEKLSELVDKGLAVKKTDSKSTGGKPKPAKAPAAKPAKTLKEDKSATVLKSVLDVIKKSRKGISIAQLKENTDLNPRQLSNALYKLTKKGSIKAVSRGIYTKA